MRGRDSAHHSGDHPVVLAEAARPLEAVALEHRRASRCAGTSRDRPAVDVLGVALDGAAAEPGDLLQRAPERGGGDASAPVVPVDEEAGDPPVRERAEAFEVGALALDARELVRSARTGTSRRRSRRRRRGRRGRGPRGRGPPSRPGSAPRSSCARRPRRGTPCTSSRPRRRCASRPAPRSPARSSRPEVSHARGHFPLRRGCAPEQADRGSATEGVGRFSASLRSDSGAWCRMRAARASSWLRD